MRLRSAPTIIRPPSEARQIENTGQLIVSQIGQVCIHCVNRLSVAARGAVHPGGPFDRRQQLDLADARLVRPRSRLEGWASFEYPVDGDVFTSTGMHIGGG